PTFSRRAFAGLRFGRPPTRVRVRARDTDRPSSPKVVDRDRRPNETPASLRKRRFVAGEPQLQKGDSGEWVQYLQQLLQSSGYWSGDADGSFGDELEQVVMQLQSSNGVSADGIVGAGTWAVLTRESAEASESTAAEASESTAEETGAGAGAAGGEQQQ